VFSSTDPLYPFGYGLSYTSFKFSDLKIKKKKLSADETVRLSVKIKNIGKVKGKEVVQVYINDKISSVSTPVKVLKAFKKVELMPSASGTVEFVIPCNEFGLWDKDMNYIVEPGEFEVMVGSSSKDIYLNESFLIKK
jgi:beta-glucosidase